MENRVNFITLELSEQKAILLNKLLKSIADNNNCSLADKYIAEEIKETLSEQLLTL